jgi:hypothetical protein
MLHDIFSLQVTSSETVCISAQATPLLRRLPWCPSTLIWIAGALFKLLHDSRRSCVLTDGICL